MEIQFQKGKSVISSIFSSPTRRLYGYLAVTILCGIFSVVYEAFSHQVYSPFMVYLFAIPLVLGVLPEVLAWVWPPFNVHSAWLRLVQDFAVATLTIGSALQGIVEIYGTTTSYTALYLIVGCGLLLASGVMWLIYYSQPIPSPSRSR